MRRVDVNVDSLSIEDVEFDAREEFGSFGAVHTEPEPRTAQELVVAYHEGVWFYDEVNS